MIIIKITSEVVECVRTFKKDRPSITFLKRIKKLHDTVAETKAGIKPNASIGERRRCRKKVALHAIPVKIEITHAD